MDKARCTKCKLCVKLCPRNNISMKEYPERRDSCEVCMRCICFCPVKAVFIPGKRSKQYQAVKAEELLKG